MLPSLSFVFNTAKIQKSLQNSKLFRRKIIVHPLIFWCVFLCFYSYRGRANSTITRSLFFIVSCVFNRFVLFPFAEQHPHWRYAIDSNQRHYPRNFKKSSLWIFSLRVIMTILDFRCIAIPSDSAENHSTCDKFGDGIEKSALHIKRRLLIHSPSTHWRWCHYNTHHQEQQERHIRPLLTAR